MAFFSFSDSGRVPLCRQEFDLYLGFPFIIIIIITTVNNIDATGSHSSGTWKHKQTVPAL